MAMKITPTSFWLVDTTLRDGAQGEGIGLYPGGGAEHEGHLDHGPAHRLPLDGTVAELPGQVAAVGGVELERLVPDAEFERGAEFHLLERRSGR